MSKKIRRITLDGSDDEFCLNDKGDICWISEEESDGEYRFNVGSVLVTAKEVDAIRKGADWHRNYKAPKLIEKTKADDHPVEFITPDSDDHYAGDVQIGCRLVDYEDVRRIHALSVKARKNRKK